MAAQRMWTYDFSQELSGRLQQVAPVWRSPQSRTRGSPEPQCGSGVGRLAEKPLRLRDIKFASCGGYNFYGMVGNDASRESLLLRFGEADAN
jgi:hypothetical protein